MARAHVCSAARAHDAAVGCGITNEAHTLTCLGIARSKVVAGRRRTAGTDVRAIGAPVPGVAVAQPGSCHALAAHAMVAACRVSCGVEGGALIRTGGAPVPKLRTNLTSASVPSALASIPAVPSWTVAAQALEACTDAIACDRIVHCGEWAGDSAVGRQVQTVAFRTVLPAPVSKRGRLVAHAGASVLLARAVASAWIGRASVARSRATYAGPATLARTFACSARAFVAHTMTSAHLTLIAWAGKDAVRAVKAACAQRAGRSVPIPLI